MWQHHTDVAALLTSVRVISWCLPLQQSNYVVGCHDVKCVGVAQSSAQWRPALLQQ
jgi:hypothetical protein